MEDSHSCSKPVRNSQNSLKRLRAVVVSCDRSESEDGKEERV